MEETKKSRTSMIRFLLGKSYDTPITPIVIKGQAFMEEMEAGPEWQIKNMKIDIEFMAREIDHINKYQEDMTRLLMRACLLVALVSLIQILTRLFS